jgi:hypothetical protein
MGGMLKAGLFLILAMAPGLAAAGCDNTWKPGTEMSACDAVGIAKQEVPSRIAEYSPAAGLRHDLGPRGTWFVTFPNVNTTPEELGWDESKPYELASDNFPWEQDLPPGTFRNLTIYINTETGEVTGRELNNGIVLGGPDSFPHCDE